MSRFEGVFFDIGGVLLDLNTVAAGHRTFLEAIARQEGIDDLDAFTTTWQTSLSEYFDGKDGTKYRRALEGYQRAIDEAVGEHLPESEWRPAFEAASERCLDPTPSAIETVTTLAAGEYYLAIISDIDTFEAEQILDQFGVADCFDHVTTSEEVGRTKPDPEIFQTALQKAPVSPDVSCYVGDRIDHDMRGGTQAGFTTIAHGGSASANADAPVVDYQIGELRELLDIVEDSPE